MQGQEREYAKSSNTGSQEDPNIDANIDFPLVIEAIASWQRKWPNGRTRSRHDWNDWIVDTQPTAFVEIIDQILQRAPERQREFMTEQRIHDILWTAFKPGTREMILDQEYQNLSRSVLESYASIILIGVYSILSLPLANSEKIVGWYLGVILDIEDPTWYRLYVGQSICIKNRVQSHLRERFTKGSYHYLTSRQPGKSATYVVLGTLNLHGLDKEVSAAILNLRELYFCLYFQTLSSISLQEYLSAEIIRVPWIGLNIANPLYQSHRSDLNLDDSEAYGKWVQSAGQQVRIRRMETLQWMPMIEAQRARYRTDRLSRNASIALGDDPLILVHCGRCHSVSSRRRDPSPLYARNGRGYIRRAMLCGFCVRKPSESAGARGCSLFHPIDPAVLSVEMRTLKGVREQPASDSTLERYDGTVVSELVAKPMLGV